MKNIIFLTICILFLAAGVDGQLPIKDGRVDVPKLILDQTPAALPQSPREARAGTDARDMELTGKVKKVTNYQEWNVGGSEQRTMVSEHFYSEDGNFLRAVDWDDVWPHRVTVFGYIDHMRVSRTKVIDHSDGFNVLLAGTDSPPVEKSKDDGVPKDTRYDNRSTFKYDAGGRLVEEQYFANTGKLISRTTFTYDPKTNRRLQLNFDAAGKEFHRAAEVLDAETGLPVQEWHYKNKKVSAIRFHTYTFDKQGNWTAKKISERLPSSKRPAKWKFTILRTIEYY